MKKLNKKCINQLINTGQVSVHALEWSLFFLWAFKISLLLSWFSYPGAIELSILSKHYQTEIAVVDIESERVDRFGKTQSLLSLNYTLRICFPKKYPMLSPSPIPPTILKFWILPWLNKVYLSTFLCNFKLLKHFLSLWHFSDRISRGLVWCVEYRYKIVFSGTAYFGSNYYKSLLTWLEF